MIEWRRGVWIETEVLEKQVELPCGEDAVDIPRGVCFRVEV